jgi:pimeloyl-ACP methyl ester carboxylesterase
MNSASLPSFSIRPSSQEEVARLLVIWRSAVEATHHFLTASDLAAIERQVAEEYLPSTDLLVAADEHDMPVGFMGLTGAHIGALFVDPALHGCGVGRLLIEHAGRRHPTLTVDVNEQNEGALGFYERLGFHCRGRSAQDDAGRPYPLLHLMRREAPLTEAAAEVVRTDWGPFPLLARGVGVPVLFLHGALGDLRTWLPHVATLSARFRCFAYTQRFFGSEPWRSDGPAFGVATHADDLIAIVEALGVGPIHVVAWSYAGHVALHAALQRPDLFESLFLFEPGVRTLALKAGERDAVVADAQGMFGPIFEAVGRGDLEQATRLLIDASGGPGYFDAQAPQRRAVHRENAHTMPLLLTQEPPPVSSGEALGTLRIPVSILWGERSRPASKVPSQAVARCLPSGHHSEVPGVGHLWPEEDPEGFCDAVAGWLDEVGPV